MSKMTKILKITLISFLVGMSFISIKNTFAVEIPMYGWMWNDFVGWIDMGGNPNSNGSNYQVTFDMQEDSAHTRLYQNSMVFSDSSRRFAWNEFIGWVDFYPNEYPGYSRLSYDAENKKIVGFARALLACTDKNTCTESVAGINAGGWDGWIRFDDDPNYSTKKISTAYSNTNNPVSLPQNCFFEGDAWGGIYTIGWLSIHDSFSFDTTKGCRVPRITSVTFSQTDGYNGNNPVVRTVTTNTDGGEDYTASSGLDLSWDVENIDDIAYYELEASIVSGSLSTDYVSQYSGYNLSHCLIDHTYSDVSTSASPRDKSILGCDVRDDGPNNNITKNWSGKDSSDVIQTYELLGDGSIADSKLKIKRDQRTIKVYPVDLSGGKIKYTLTAYNKFGDTYLYDTTVDSNFDGGVTSNYTLTMRSWTNIRRNDNRTDVNVFSEIQDSPLDEGTYTFKLCQHDTSDWSIEIPTSAASCPPVEKNDFSGNIDDIEYKVSSLRPSICPSVVDGILAPGDVSDGCNDTASAELDLISATLKDNRDPWEYPIVFEGIGIPSYVPVFGIYEVDVLMTYQDTSGTNYPDKARRNTIKIRNIGFRTYREVSP